MLSSLYHVARILAAGCAVLALAAPGCRSGAGGSTCSPVDPAAPGVFTPCEYGSGQYGRWIVDDHGLPAYDYTLAEESSPLASWWNTEKKTRRDHWHQIGNGRVTATIYNEGYTQLFSQENGLSWMNYFAGAEKNYSGGFSILSDGGSPWASAYAYRPAGAASRRIFGLGYGLAETRYRGVSVTRTTYAPFGDDPLLLSDIIVWNNGTDQKTITHDEYWDVNIHQIFLKLISSGVLSPSIPGANEEERRTFNQYFTQTAGILPSGTAAFVRTVLTQPYAGPLSAPAPGGPKNFNDAPPLIFLAPVGGPVSPSDGFILDQASYFGSGDASAPAGARSAGVLSSPADVPAGLAGVSGLGQPLALIHRKTFTLKPGESAALRYAYGYTDTTTGISVANAYQGTGAPGLEATLDTWKKRLFLFAPGSDPFLHREMAWNSYYLQSASAYRRYLDTHIVPQGGEYLFGHGLEGAARDYSIFSVPLSYLNPPLAREILRFIMMTTGPDGEISYGNVGDTVTAGAGIHTLPSDLDIFFLWALTEYITATRDTAFLSETVPYYSAAGILGLPATYTVLDHALGAFTHLARVVGTGEHGLLRLRTGDWSDGSLYFADDPNLAEQKGESAFNTAFAAAILPGFASLLTDTATADAIRAQASAYRAAMDASWAGSWYYRGWQGNGLPIGDDRVFLEPQSWALIAGIPDAGRTAALLGALRNKLDAGSPAGARILVPPLAFIPATGFTNGMDVNGGIWPAMNSVLTWAYSLYNTAYGWESLKKNTMAAHTEAYPGIWYGIWTGPDSFNAPENSRPGQAAAHLATALTDYPAMNMNMHANPLLAAIKVAGITPTAGGILIAPRIPAENWSLSLPLLGVRYSAEAVTGYYRGGSSGSMTMSVAIPAGRAVAGSVLVNGAGTSFTASSGCVTFALPYSTGTITSWAIVLGGSP